MWDFVLLNEHTHTLSPAINVLPLADSQGLNNWKSAMKITVKCSTFGCRFVNMLETVLNLPSVSMRGGGGGGGG